MSERFWAWAWYWNYIPMLMIAALILLTGCAANELCYTAARAQWQMTPSQATVWCYLPPWGVR